MRGSLTNDNSIISYLLREASLLCLPSSFLVSVLLPLPRILLCWTNQGMCLKHSPYRQTKRRREVCPLPSLSLFLFLLLLILDVFSCDPCSLLLRQSHRPFLLLFFHLLFFLCLSWFALRSVSSYHYILSFPQ